ncbi:MAG: hypothetical protein Q9196_001548 [Gyalolechia fulgens]
MADSPAEKVSIYMASSVVCPRLKSQQQLPAHRLDYEGLELDTRAGDGADKHLDHTKPLPDLRKWQHEEENNRYLNEKQMIQAHEIPLSSPTSPQSSMGVRSPLATQAIAFADPVGSPPEPRLRRICGLRRGIFWLVFGIVLAVVIVAAVVGGVVGGIGHISTSGDGPTSGGNLPASNNVPAQPADVIGASPLNVISHNRTGTGTVESTQVFRVYYQSVLGNIKEAVMSGLNTQWETATPIFTDAINNTGLATTTYMNGSAPNGQIFYVGTNGLLQEKRKNFEDRLYWLPGTLNPKNIKMIGNLSVPANSKTKDPVNQFDSFRIAAVHSEHFWTGAGTRLFYHASADNGSWVQEWIWTKETDDWRIGQAITNVYPNSHIAATVDEQNRLLRLYFSSGDLTLQEMWLNISDPLGIYNNGFSLPNFLPQNNAELTATSFNGTIYLYHPSNVGELGIRELIVSGVPASIGLLSNSPQESYNLSEPLVARPSLTSREGTSPYQPLGAGITSVQGIDGGPKVFVLWADQVTGRSPAVQGSVTGYNTLQANSRALAGGGTWYDVNRTTIPLGSTNSYPVFTQRRRLRWVR